MTQCTAGARKALKDRKTSCASMEKEYLYRQKRASENSKLARKAVSQRHQRIAQSSKNIGRFRELKLKARDGKLGYFEKKEYLKMLKQSRSSNNPSSNLYGTQDSNILYIKTKNGNCVPRENMSSEQIKKVKGYGMRVFSSEYSCKNT